MATERSFKFPCRGVRPAVCLVTLMQTAILSREIDGAGNSVVVMSDRANIASVHFLQPSGGADVMLPNQCDALGTCCGTAQNVFLQFLTKRGHEWEAAQSRIYARSQFNLDMGLGARSGLGQQRRF